MTCTHCSKPCRSPFIVGGMVFCNPNHASKAMNQVIEHFDAHRSMQRWLNSTPTYEGNHP